MIFSILHQLVIIFDWNFLILSLLTKVIKDLISNSVPQSIVIITVEQERILVVSLRVSLVK